MSDKYFELVKKFPLRKMRSDAERSAAAKIVRDLGMGGEPAPDPGENDYLEALGSSSRITNARSIRSKGSPLGALRAMMEERGMRPVDLANILGSQSSATVILKGEREMSKAHIRKLAEFFNVSQRCSFSHEAHSPARQLSPLGAQPPHRFTLA